MRLSNWPCGLDFLDCRIFNAFLSQPFFQAHLRNRAWKKLRKNIKKSTAPRYSSLLLFLDNIHNFFDYLDGLHGGDHDHDLCLGFQILSPSTGTTRTAGRTRSVTTSPCTTPSGAWRTPPGQSGVSPSESSHVTTYRDI